MRLDGYLGTNCPYEEIFPKLRKNCSEHTWLIPLTVFIKFIIFLKEQAKIPLACTLKATKCKSLYLFMA